jgi:hypothetical protein
MSWCFVLPFVYAKGLSCLGQQIGENECIVSCELEVNMIQLAVAYCYMLFTVLVFRDVTPYNLLDSDRCCRAGMSNMRTACGPLQAHLRPAQRIL